MALHILWSYYAQVAANERPSCLRPVSMVSNRKEQTSVYDPFIVFTLLPVLAD
jgi:hypothetical protein